MAESIAFDIAAGSITKFCSFVLCQVGLWWNFKDDLDDLERMVNRNKAVLLDAEERSESSNRVKVWLEELKDALYDVEDLLDDVHTEALRKDLLSGNKFTKEVRVFFSKSNQFAHGRKMGRKIKAMKARFTSIQNELNNVPKDHLVQAEITGDSVVDEVEIIGRDNDKEALLKILLEFQSEENVCFIPIVGIGGLGKTALAQIVYNDEMIKYQFELMMWVCVSVVFDLKTVVAKIIRSATGQVPDQKVGLSRLKRQLRGIIDGKKYLLVLDDLWNEGREKWCSLKKLLKGGAKGSRVMVTTRSKRVAKITSKCEPYVLKGLSDDDAWSLFKEIAFEQRSADATNPTFLKIGKQILESCKGVPLVIRTVASTLSFTKTENEWLPFKNNGLAGIDRYEGIILSTLMPSYNHLPSHLKHCFAYCRLYPKGHEINVQTLVQLWIAQGFIEKSNSSQSLEEIGFGYFEDLAERSFFEEVQGYEYCGMTCKMHDLMHYLAESVAGRESSILGSISNDVSKVDGMCRHISVDFSLISLFKGQKLRTFPLFKGKKLQTLLHFPNQKDGKMSEATLELVISNCRCLRVLELDDLSLNTVPGSIHKLKHLRYLDLSDNYGLQILPTSICRIPHLQVLKLDRCSQLEELPKKIENLVNLNHLACDGCRSLTHMPHGIGKLTSLQTLSLFVVDKCGSHGAAAADLSELCDLNNLRGELRITNLGWVKNAQEEYKAANLKEKKHLRSLVLEWGDTFPTAGDEDDDEKSLEDLQPHPNLKELKVIGWRGDANIPSWLSSLTNLTFLSIEQSPRLDERCRKDIGADWHKIAHIPNIEVNGTLVQNLP